MNTLVMNYPLRPLLAFASMGTAFGLLGAVEAYALLSTDSFSLGAAFSAATALTGCIGLLAGVLAALILPRIVDALNPRVWYQEYLGQSQATEGPDKRKTWAANAFAKLGAVAVLGIWVGLFGGISHSFNQRRLTMLFVSIGGISGLAVAWVFVINSQPVLKGIFDRFGRDGRMLVMAPGLAVALLLAIVVMKITNLDLGAYQTERILWPGFGLLVGLGIYVLAQRSTKGIQHICLGAGLVASVWAFVFVSMDNDWPRIANPIIKRGASTAAALTGLRYLADGDGDGSAAAFGGGDCDDTDARVGPHAREIPGNGIDDNCRGGDAPLPAPKVRPKTPVPQPQQAATPKPKPVVSARAEPKRYNIVYIFIDTLRADRLGMNGYKRPTSPNLDRFAEDALIFDRAYSQAPNTPRSFPSMITGRYPSRIKWVKRYSNYGKLTGENETLFTIFNKAGWRTEMVSAHWYFQRAKGIEKGLDYWDNKGALSVRESNTQSAAPLITKKLMGRLDVLEKEKKPFAILAHYFDPHGKYMRHRQSAAFGKKGLSNKYDGEIAFVDHHLKPVLARLSKAPWAEDTIVIVTSDHGEAFKEHGFYFHGRTVYDEETRIPLLIRIPGVKSTHIAETVGAVDILPTLVELTGLKAPEAQGESLVGLWTKKGVMPTRPVFMEQLPYPGYKKHIVGAVDRKGRFKIIQNLTDNVLELFDLTSDPGEKVNVLNTKPTAGKGLRQALEQFIDGDPQ